MENVEKCIITGDTIKNGAFPEVIYETETVKGA
jgi:hypothetical protein